MTNDFLSVLMNLMMAGLLLATIIYCLKLNARIKVLQDSKSELARIIREFDDSTQRATQNINEIHAATMRISENMQHKIDKANYLADDLEALLDKGNKMAGKVDAAPVRPTRQDLPAASAGTPRTLADIMPGRSQAVEAEPTEQGRRPLRTRSRAEQDLMNLMGNKNEAGNR
ncbi:MAG: DUF6468 domain-containing protein [Rickettsiales bacterium]